MVCCHRAVGLVAVGVGDNMLRVWRQNNAVNSYDVQSFWQGIKSKVTAVSATVSLVYSVCSESLVLEVCVM